MAIALSHKQSLAWREFERTSTTVVDSYLAPMVRKYLSMNGTDLKDHLPPGQGLHVMESKGGVMTGATASETPLQTLLSGPIGGNALSAATGRPNLICVDMGGTSFDASLIIDGQPSASNETKMEGLPVQISVVDIHVIGAGGGSIARHGVGRCDWGHSLPGHIRGRFAMAGTGPRRLCRRPTLCWGVWMAATSWAAAWRWTGLRPRWHWPRKCISRK